MKLALVFLAGLALGCMAGVVVVVWVYEDVLRRLKPIPPMRRGLESDRTSASARALISQAG